MKIGFLQNESEQNRKRRFEEILLGEKYPHAMVVGETGSGKTSGVLLPTIKSILETDQNAGIFAIDYKGNLGGKIKALAKKVKRLKKVVEIGSIGSPKINPLLKDFSPEQFSDILYMQDPLSGNQDRFWINNSVNLLVPVYRFFQALYVLKNILASTSTIKKSHIAKIGDYDRLLMQYGYKKNEISYAQLLQTLDSVQSYKEFLRFVKEIEHLTIKLFGYLYTDYGSHKKITKQRNVKIGKIYLGIQKLIRAIEKVDSSSKIVVEDEEGGKTIHSILATIQSVIGDLARNDLCNKSEVDIFDLLQTGHIVILNTLNIPDSILPHIIYAINHQARKRFSDARNINRIYLFFDEAQRVLTPQIDIAMDTLREAKVHIMLLFQNTSLLVKAIGENNFFAIANNTPLKIAMKGEPDPYGIFTEEVRVLKAFEYFVNIDGFSQKHKTDPLFISYHEEFRAMHRYQRINKIHEKFGISHKELLIANDFNALLENKIKLVDQKEEVYFEEILLDNEEIIEFEEMMLAMLDKESKKDKSINGEEFDEIFREIEEDVYF